MNRFIERFTELIKEKGEQQKELAKKINRTPQLITNWKRGDSEPCIDDLIKLADYFNVCIDYLVGRQDYM